jgi:uncharacterized protein YkwD
MKPSRSYHKQPLVFSLAFLTFLLSLQGRQFSADSSAIPTPSPKHVFVSNFKWEEYILEEVNRLREEKGLGRLKINPKAQAAARNHSLDMAKLGYFSHKDLEGRFLDERLRQVKLGGWKAIAENIAKGDASSNPTTHAVDGWTKSPGHAKNMFNPQFTETGVGAVLDPDGAVLFCQVFVAR